jgi:hypothetical protein
MRELTNRLISGFPNDLSAETLLFSLNKKSRHRWGLNLLLRYAIDCLTCVKQSMATSATGVRVLPEMLELIDARSIQHYAGTQEYLVRDALYQVCNQLFSEVLARLTSLAIEISSLLYKSEIKVLIVLKDSQ